MYHKWSLGLDRPLAYFLVLLHNVLTKMYIFPCVLLYTAYVEEDKLCYVTKTSNSGKIAYFNVTL